MSETPSGGTSDHAPIPGEPRIDHVARIWHGWTNLEDADAYERLLRAEILPSIDRIDGYLGADLLRSDDADGGEVEFVTITQWRSLDAVRTFAGDDYTLAVVSPDARKLLTRFDDRSAHYRVVERVS